MQETDEAGSRLGAAPGVAAAETAPPAVTSTADVEPSYADAAYTTEVGPQRAAVRAVWTVERGLYALIFLLGCLLRAWNLGGMPLSAWEASNAWPAWLAAQALTVESAPAPVSALAYGFQWLTFWLGMDGDVGARLVGLLAGAALPVTVWWWRPWLGRSVALWLALLLAIDPWLIGLSRVADGASLGLLLGLMALIGLSRLVLIPSIAGQDTRGQETSSREQLSEDSQGVGDQDTAAVKGQLGVDAAGILRFVAIAVGLMLVAGPVGWNMLPVVGLFGWLWRRELQRYLVSTSSPLLWLLGAMLLGATFGFLRLDGVRWLASGFDVWLSQFDGTVTEPLVAQITGGYGWGWPWLRLLADAPLLPVAGVAGALMWMRRIATIGAEPEDTPRMARQQGASTDGATGREAHSEVHSEASDGPRQIHTQRWLWLLLGWLVWGLVLLMLPGRSPLALPVMGLPLLVLAAVWLSRIVAATAANLERRETGILLGTLVVLGVSTAFWVAALFSTTILDPVLLPATGVLLLLAVVILVAYGFWSGRKQAQWLVAVLVAGLLLLFHLRGGWLLAQTSFLEPAGFLAATAHPEVEQLAADIETLSAHRTGDSRQAPVIVRPVGYTDFSGNRIPARPDPIVGWALRHMHNLTWADAIEPGAGLSRPMAEGEDQSARPLVVMQLASGVTDIGAHENSAPGNDAPGNGVQSGVLSSGYAGSTYAVEAWWRPGDLFQSSGASGDSVWRPRLKKLWQWSVYRQVDALPTTRDIALWAPLEQ